MECEDYIIQLTLKDDEGLQAEDLVDEIRNLIADYGWSIRQSGPQSSMTESLVRERAFVRTLLQEFPDE